MTDALEKVVREAVRKASLRSKDDPHVSAEYAAQAVARRDAEIAENMEEHPDDPHIASAIRMEWGLTEEEKR